MFNYNDLQDKLNYHFKNPALLISALNRGSPIAASGMTTKEKSAIEKIPDHEHLEFLGDRVINLYVTDCLSQLHPEWTPEQLSAAYIHYTRNNDASAKHGGPLYRIAKEIDLKTYIILKARKPLDHHGKRGKQRYGKSEEGLLSDHIEALIGAIYLDLNRNFSALTPILNGLFEPLGLLTEDHKSVTEFGASASGSHESSDEAEMISEIVGTQQRFIALVSKGRHRALVRAALTVDNETAVSGLWIAVLNNHHNVLSYILNNCPVEISDIEEVLTDEALSPIARASLNNHLERLNALAKSKLFSVTYGGWVDYSEDDEAELGNDAVFLEFARTGNQQGLIKGNYNVSSAVAIKGLNLAIDNRKPNILIYIIQRYGIEIEALEEILRTKAKLLFPEVRGCLEKQIRKKKAATASSATFSGAGDALSTTFLSVTFNSAQFDGYFIKKIIGDGNCFFHAVADQLNILGIFTEDGSAYTHEFLRALVTSHVDTLPELRAFFTDADLVDLNRLGGWVGEQAVRALADLLKLEFQIHRSDGAPEPPIIRGEGAVEGRVVHLLYNGSNHYDSLQMTAFSIKDVVPVAASV